MLEQNRHRATLIRMLEYRRQLARNGAANSHTLAERAALEWALERLRQNDGEDESSRHNSDKIKLLVRRMDK